MAFHHKYLNSFYLRAGDILEKYAQQQSDDLEIGEFALPPYPDEAIIEVMDSWVSGVDHLLTLSKNQSHLSLDKRYAALYQERGITYNEYYYLFSSHINNEDYINTPAFLFTQTYSDDQRAQRFGNMTFSPENYSNYILSLEIVPSYFLKQIRQAKIAPEVLYAHSYCVAKTRSGKTELLKLIIHNLILHGDRRTSMLVLDPHGEFAREIRRLKIVKENIDNFIYLDPAIDGTHSPVFNPFQIKNKSITGLAYTTDTILDAFQQLLKDQAITGNMRRLLRHCIFALLYHDGTTMMDMLTLLQAISRNRSKKEPEFYPEEERLMNLGRSAADPLTQRFFEFGWRDVDSRTVSAVIERIDGI